MPVEPISRRVKKGWPVAAATTRGQIGSGIVDREGVVAIDSGGRDSDRFGARCGAGAAGGLGRTREGRKSVVLSHEYDRQIVDPRPIQSLQERSTIDRTIAEEAHADTVVTE